MALMRRDLTNQRFGRLTVVSKNTEPGNRRLCWNCDCECGAKKVVCTNELTAGKVRSCGCLRRELAAEKMVQHCTPKGIAAVVSHAMTKTKIYSRWAGMWARCTNPNHRSFHRYGGRGIKVCDRWKDFALFLADVGLPPTPTHSLDRYPNKDGDYAPDNIRWATPKQQAENSHPKGFHQQKESN